MHVQKNKGDLQYKYEYLNFQLAGGYVGINKNYFLFTFTHT